MALEIVVLVGQQEDGQQARRQLRDVTGDKLNQGSLPDGDADTDATSSEVSDDSCQPELEQTSKSQDVESLAKQQPASSSNNNSSSGTMIDNISERLSRLQTRGESSSVAKDSPKRKSMVSIRLLKQQHSNSHSQENEVAESSKTQKGNTMSNSESEEYKLLMKELKKRQVSSKEEDDESKQVEAATTTKTPEVIEEEDDDDEEEEEEKANGLSSLARATKPVSGGAVPTNGRFSMLRQSFSHKTISSMLKYGRASMRIKQPAAAAAASTLALTGPAPAAHEDAAAIESKVLAELTARDAEKKAKALAVAEANLLAARQLKQQAEKLKKQQKRELQQLESASYMLMATQYNQQIQRQLQLQQQQQQQQLLYQQAQQYAAVASSGQMFDASGVHQLQQQFLLQQQRQQHQQQQQQHQHQQQQMAYYMAAQQMAASVIQPPGSSAMMSLITATGMAPPQASPAALMYQPHPAALTYKQQESISGLMKAPMSVSEAIYASAQQHRQQQQQQMVPMSVNHHSSFDIVYGPPSSHHHQSDMYHAAQLVDQSHTIHNSKQQQYHHRQQLPHQQQQQQLPQSKLPKPAARTSLGASMRKTVKSILNHRSSVLNNQANNKDSGSISELRKAPEPAPRQTVAAVANGERKLKSVLKTSASNNNNNIAGRNLVVLNSEGSDGDGSSSDSTLTNSDSNKSSSQIMPKSVLKKSSSSSSTSSSTSSCSVSAASSSDSSLSSCNHSSSHSPEPTRDFSGRRASDESTTASVTSCGTIVAGNGGTLKRNIACRQSVKVLPSSDQERIAAIRASKRRSVAMGTTGRKNVTFSAKLISIV